MKALLWDGGVLPDCLHVGDVPKPKVEKDWVVIKVKIGGICGSDLHLLHGETSHLISKLPAVIGHEVSGVVEEVGEGVGHVQEGDRVSLEILHGCLELAKEPCDMCKTGQYQLCRNLTAVGFPGPSKVIPGGYGEYSTAHKNRVYKLPDNVGFEEGATVDPLACGVRAVNRSGHGMNDSAVVIG